jgi:hypothetical protein
MITLREQLQDPYFRKWITTPPKLRVVGTKPPWVVYVQREVDGNWAKAEFMTYAKAFNFVKKNLKKYHDFAINCRRQGFQPPVVRIGGVKKVYKLPPGTVDGHVWCPHCRRMTLFRYFTHRRHPVLGQVDPNSARCVICGVRLESITRYRGA